MHRGVRTDRMCFLEQMIEGRVSCRADDMAARAARAAQARAAAVTGTAAASGGVAGGGVAGAPADDINDDEPRCPALRSVHQLMKRVASSLGDELERAPRSGDFPMRFADEGAASAPPPRVLGVSDMQVTCYEGAKARYRLRESLRSRPTRSHPACPLGAWPP